MLPHLKDYINFYIIQISEKYATIVRINNCDSHKLCPPYICPKFRVGDKLEAKNPPFKVHIWAFASPTYVSNPY